ncbi:MAG: RNase adapter RapZ [Actinobacteria bacterium]|nr:RNase adapter RapZ [Actinomycetota bacterium]
MNESEKPSNRIQLLIVTGMSGAGRSETMRALEDIGYYCVDNLPPRFILNLVELLEMESRNIMHVAASCDVRSKDYFPELLQVIAELKKRGIAYKVIYLEAEDETLVKRFKKDRRRHPLSESGKIIDGVKKERRVLEEVKSLADYIIDTSNFELYQLKEKIKSIVVGSDRYTLLISVESFGFKFGIPLDSDLIFDIRFLPNPYYEENLKNLTGLDEEVKKFVMSFDDTKIFLEKTIDLLDFLIPRYEKEGKTHLVISIGCTGGKHRSVVISEEIASRLRKKSFNVTVTHRDIAKET